MSKLEEIAEAQAKLPGLGAVNRQNGSARQFTIRNTHWEVLDKIAAYERRDTRDQASVLLEWAIKHWTPDT